LVSNNENAFILEGGNPLDEVGNDENGLVFAYAANPIDK
jgi:hypothetical protein